MKTYMKPTGAVRLDPCTYGLSKVTFRGPRRPTDGRFIACLGSSETFARYVPEPYPALLERQIGEVCVNLGCQAAGPDVFLQDSAVPSLLHDAAATVIEVPGAVNLSNEFYRVHPRRNDRFIAPTRRLRALFPEVDFAEIAFTGHLMKRLAAADSERLQVVTDHLQAAWTKRMAALIEMASGPAILLWFAPVALGTDESHMGVNTAMVEALRPRVDDVIEVVAQPGNIDGMVFPPLEQLAAMEMMGADAHQQVAKALRMPLTHALS